MSTRSTIVAKTTDGQWSSIYCHWDGQPDGVGATLVDHFQSTIKVDRLMSLGNLSSLAPKLTKPNGHSFERPIKGHSVAYGRDRGEKDQEAKRGKLPDVLPDAHSWCEWCYLWDGMAWYYAPIESVSISGDWYSRLGAFMPLRANAQPGPTEHDMIQALVKLGEETSK